MIKARGEGTWNARWGYHPRSDGVYALRCEAGRENTYSASERSLVNTPWGLGE